MALPTASSGNNEDEDYDELPSITVNSSGRDLSILSLPGAAAVAAERARERRCEAELARLRAADPGPMAGPMSRSDSSGSEGEAALAAAVTALQVAGSSRRRPRPRLHTLLPAAAVELPSAARTFLLGYARAAAALSPRAADRLARRTFARIESWVAGSPRPTDEERCGCGAWLLLAAVGAERAALGAGGLRAAHAVLANGAPVSLAGALQLAVEGARARLELGDSLRAAGEAGALLGGAVSRGALSRLLPTAAGWRDLSARDRYTALQLAARTDTRLLHALTAPHQHARDNTADNLKVVVAASKMQVLFPVKK